MVDAREVNLGLDLCLRVGELLLSSGAGAADVTATMQSLSYALGLREASVDITFTSLAMTYQDTPDDIPIVSTRQVKQRAIDYEHLTRVDHLVRDVLRGDLDLRGARTELGRITSTGHPRARWAVTLGWGVMCAGVGVQLGGDWAVIGLALVAAITIDRIQLRMARRRMPSFYQQVVGGGVATLIALGVSATPISINVSQVVTANIIMLLAGIGFMGALQDALTGFYVTATARLTEAFLATAGIIAGVSGGLSIGAVLGLEIPRLQPGEYSLQTVGMLALGSALAAAAFAYSCYAPKRILLPIALVAGTAISISGTLQNVGIGRAWGVAIAALFVGLVSFSVSGWMRVPPLVVVVSAVVPMLPGLSIYRGLTLLGEGGSSIPEGLLAMTAAISVAIALSSGVILGEYVAQPLKREAQRLETRLTGPRLVGPVDHVVRRDRWRRRRTAPDGSQTDEVA